jgi:hypothetical protein
MNPTVGMSFDSIQEVEEFYLYYYLSVYRRRPHWPVVHGSALSACPHAALLSIDVVFHLTLSARLPSSARSLRPRNRVAPRVPFHPWHRRGCPAINSQIPCSPPRDPLPPTTLTFHRQNGGTTPPLGCPSIHGVAATTPAITVFVPPISPSPHNTPVSHAIRPRPSRLDPIGLALVAGAKGKGRKNQEACVRPRCCNC